MRPALPVSLPTSCLSFSLRSVFPVASALRRSALPRSGRSPPSSAALFHLAAILGVGDFLHPTSDSPARRLVLRRLRPFSGLRFSSLLLGPLLTLFFWFMPLRPSPFTPLPPQPLFPPRLWRFPLPAQAFALLSRAVSCRVPYSVCFTRPPTLFTLPSLPARRPGPPTSPPPFFFFFRPPPPVPLPSNYTGY